MNDLVYQLIAANSGTPAWLLQAASAVAQDGIFLVPALMVLSWIGGSARDRQSGVAAAFAAAIALGAATIISSVYFHPRPFMVGLAANITDHAPDSSMPSDHAAVLFAVFTTYAAANGWSWITAVMGLLALSVSWARVFTGIHFPADILVSAILGAAATWAVQTTPLRRFVAVVNGWGEAAIVKK